MAAVGDPARARLWGEDWVRVAGAPRPIVESWRAMLREHDIPSALKTPWGWVTTTNIIELEAGTFYGFVELFVLEMHATEARALLPLEGEGADLEADAVS
jgi:hypothetical protein